MATDDVRTAAPPPQRGLIARPGLILALLFAANLLNFYDRTIPAIVVEPLKAEFSLSDAQIGLISAAFTIVYAVVGIPLGRLADRISRKWVLAVCLVAWSLFTAATGMADIFLVLVFIRLLVGVGEAGFAPAATSMIADLYPSERRARAAGLLQLGLPVGLILAYFTVGSITEAFGTWRAAFLLAAVPGLFLAVLLLFVREPLRGAAERVAPAPPAAAPSAPVLSASGVERPFQRLLRTPTLWWLVFAGIGAQVSAYAVTTFSVPLFQRFFGTDLTTGALLTGVTVGLTGLVGLTAGGRAADLAGRRSPAARVGVGAASVLAAVPLTFVPFLFGAEAIGLFTAVFSLGWLLQYVYFTAAYPAIADVAVPRLRGTAMAVYLAASYLLGGALGPLLAGALSDRFAAAAVGVSAAQAAAVGLHTSLMIVVPAGLLVAGLGLLGASRTIARDSARKDAEV
ncbi:spinster family MFS transporter [Nocardiopsis protaetiae]|uniref:spinster family MFS transporter n=1 Tax=Nocardiopsis protaetiae TaxID=3382270 RepID=UPI00387B4C75